MAGGVCRCGIVILGWIVREGMFLFLGTGGRWRGEGRASGREGELESLAQGSVVGGGSGGGDMSWGFRGYEQGRNDWGWGLRNLIVQERGQ